MPFSQRSFRLFSVDDMPYHNTHSDLSYLYTEYVINGKMLYTIANNQLRVYDMFAGTKAVHSFTEMDEILYIYVDGDDRFIVEGSKGDGFVRGIMKNDGSFSFNDADLGFDVVQKVKTKNN